MVRAREEEEHRCPDEDMREVSHRRLRRGRGRPKNSWEDVIRQDMTQLELTEDMSLDKRVWISRIRVKG